MKFSDFWAALAEAVALLWAHPWRWMWITLLFLLGVEALMFIPIVGFVAKLAVAAVISAHMLSMMDQAAKGQTPRPSHLLQAFKLPWGGQLVLMLAALLPFVAGIAFLHLKAGSAATAFFFSRIWEAKPPEVGLFMQFKTVMQLVALPLAFVSGAVALKGLAGWHALDVALRAALAHWRPLLVLGLFDFAFEQSMGYLPALLPKWAVAALGGVATLAFLMLSFALLYTLSVRALGLKPPPTAS